MIETSEFFKKNNYLVIENFIDKNTATLLYQYCKTKAAAIDFKKFYDVKFYNSSWDGRFDDPQAPGAYSLYGDPIMDSVLFLTLETMKNLTGLELLHNYSYWRLYQKGNILKRHRDRPSCEISATLCLGFDVSNIDQTKYPDYKWPMWVNSQGEEIPISLNPGDIIIYKGCEIEHWREEFIGLNHAQVFLHYNDANGPYKITNDNRPLLGIPKIN